MVKNAVARRTPHTVRSFQNGFKTISVNHENRLRFPVMRHSMRLSDDMTQDHWIVPIQSRHMKSCILNLGYTNFFPPPVHLKSNGLTAFHEYFTNHSSKPSSNQKRHFPSHHRRAAAPAPPLFVAFEGRFVNRPFRRPPRERRRPSPGLPTNSTTPPATSEAGVGPTDRQLQLA